MSSEATVSNSGFYFPSQSILTSRNLYLFLLDYYSVVDLFYFTLNLAFHADDAALTASKVLIKSAENEEDRKRYQMTIDNPEKAVKKLKDFSSLNSKNLTVTTVDAFLWFISSTIQGAMKKRPEMVKSGESVKIEDIFEFSNKRELINYLIDRKVNSLSYGGMSKIEKFINDSMGITMFRDNNERDLMQILVEVRNIHVHNRGFVNRVFLSRVTEHENFHFVEGERAHLDFDELISLTRVCVQTAIDLDIKICKKFGIERKRYSTWRKAVTTPKSNSAKPV
ncbi:MAG: hypothetical protein ACT6Q8_09025 [Niveispirillum sp.]|uniref:hypothetical protein n=1 Tax=Niveispirillum sp. TaxID=1917217 RepID=UPI0040351802